MIGRSNVLGMAVRRVASILDVLDGLCRKSRAYALMDRFLSSLLFGNYARFHNNLIGMLNLLIIAGISPFRWFSLKQIQTFTVNFDSLGFCPRDFLRGSDVIESFAMPEESDEEGEGNRQLQTAYRVLYPNRKLIKAERQRLQSLVNRIIDSDGYQSISNGYYNNRMNIAQITIEERYPNKLVGTFVANDVVELQKFRAYNTNYHIDPMLIDRARIYIALSDLTDDCGGTCYVSRRGTKSAIRKALFSSFGMNIGQLSGGRFLDQDLLENDKSKVGKLVGGVGTSVFFNPNMVFHQGRIPKEGNTRLLLTLLVRAGNQESSPI